MAATAPAPAPTPTHTTTPSLHDKAHQLITTTRHPDVTKLATQLVHAATPSQRRQLAIRGAAEIIRSILSDQRQPRKRPPDNHRPNLERSTPSLDLAKISIYSNGEHRWLLDCDEPFLRASAAQDHAAGQALIDAANRKTRLADLLATRGDATHVRDLQPGLVLDIWTQA